MRYRQFTRLLALLGSLLGTIVLGGCAGPGSLAIAPQTGNVRIYNAGQAEDWPAQFVHWNYPGAAFTGPFSKQLWDLGHRILLYHCFYLDPAGAPTRVTLMGLVKATVDKNGKGLFKGRLSPADIAVASNDGSRLEAIFTDAIMADAGGDPDRVQQVLNAALEHDTKCLRNLLADLHLRINLNQENKALVSDETGRQIAITIEPRPDYNIRLMHWIETHEKSVRDLRGIYEDIAAKLTRRLVRPAPRVASPAPAVSPRGPAIEQKQKGISAATPAHSGRITVNTAPLQEIEREAAAMLKKLKENCLLTARINCT